MPEKIKVKCRYCGAEFETSNRQRVYCSYSCRNKYSLKKNGIVSRAERAAAKKARADRLFDRDARYAKWELENDARPRIEERPDRIVETRGRCGIAPRITHLGRN